MGNEPLANLARTGALKAEPADKNECVGLATAMAVQGFSLPSGA